MVQCAVRNNPDHALKERPVAAAHQAIAESLVGTAIGSPLQRSGGPPTHVCECGMRHGSEQWHPRTWCFRRFQKDLLAAVPDLGAALLSPYINELAVADDINEIFQRYSAQIKRNASLAQVRIICDERMRAATTYARRIVASCERAAARTQQVFDAVA